MTFRRLAAVLFALTLAVSAVRAQQEPPRRLDFTREGNVEEGVIGTLEHRATLALWLLA